eukprot:GHVT01063988.1.p1 GENE.GHVT01063988.1~~GHVT01063988.1.p1  ORF type:complete len:460 (-),score=55.80 GHVT01063988.1:704-2083(-)
MATRQRNRRPQDTAPAAKRTDGRGPSAPRTPQRGGSPATASVDAPTITRHHNDSAITPSTQPRASAVESEDSATASRKNGSPGLQGLLASANLLNAVSTPESAGLGQIGFLSAREPTGILGRRGISGAGTGQNRGDGPGFPVSAFQEVVAHFSTFAAITRQQLRRLFVYNVKNRCIPTRSNAELSRLDDDIDDAVREVLGSLEEFTHATVHAAAETANGYDPTTSATAEPAGVQKNIRKTAHYSTMKRSSTCSDLPDATEYYGTDEPKCHQPGQKENKTRTEHFLKRDAATKYMANQAAGRGDAGNSGGLVDEEDATIPPSITQAIGLVQLWENDASPKQRQAFLNHFPQTQREAASVYLEAITSAGKNLAFTAFLLPSTSRLFPSSVDSADALKTASGHSLSLGGQWQLRLALQSLRLMNTRVERTEAKLQRQLQAFRDLRVSYYKDIAQLKLRLSSR